MLCKDRRRNCGLPQFYGVVAFAFITGQVCLRARRRLGGQAVEVVEDSSARAARRVAQWGGAICTRVLRACAPGRSGSVHRAVRLRARPGRWRDGAQLD